LLLARNAVGTAQAIRAQNDIDGRFATARAYGLIGDILRRRDPSAASAAWRNALAVWPNGTPETPRQIAIRMEVLNSLGQMREAGELRQKLVTMGYRVLI
jgi:hypothetical protein